MKFGLFAAAGAASVLMSGCGVYVHQQALETATGAVQKSFDGISAPAFFEAQRATLQAYGAKEDQAVGGFVLARRNAQLLEVVRPSPLTPQGQRQTLAALIDGELQDIYGMPPNATTLETMAKAPGLLADIRMQEEAATGAVRMAAGAYVSALEALNADRRNSNQPELAKLPVDCSKVDTSALDRGQPAVVPQGQPPVYEGMIYACGTLKSVEAFRGGAGSSGIAQLYAGARGDLKVVWSELQERRAKRAAAKVTAAALAAQVKAITERKADPGDQGEFRKKVQELAPQLKDASPYVKMAGLETLASFFEDAAAASLKSDTSETGSSKARVSAALQLIDAGLGLSDVYASSVDVDTGNAALIGLAVTTHELKVTKLEVALQDRLIGNLEAQLTALLQKTRHLARARQLVTANRLDYADGWAELGSSTIRTRSAAGEALSAYAASWDEGEAPYQMLRYRAVQEQRLAALERAATSEADFRASLKPAIDQLAAYGKGGIKEDTIVDTAGRLGVAGALLGDK